MPSPFYFLLLCAPSLTTAFPSNSLWSPWRRASQRSVPENGFYDPSARNGSMLTQIPVTYPMGLGEPINIIITGASDEAVLANQQTDGGLLNLFLSWGFSGSCLGQQAGSNQYVDLGDGNGYKPETAVIRWNYGDPTVGTCTETIEGGNHFRYWIQDGDAANSGAIFLAASYELPIKQGHDIIYNGYNLGRDYLLFNFTSHDPSFSTFNLSANANETSYSTTSSWAGYKYAIEWKYQSGLLGNTSEGVNHQYSVGGNGVNAMDGLVAVMTVKIAERPAGSNGLSAYTPRTMFVVTSAVILGSLALAF